MPRMRAFISEQEQFSSGQSHNFLQLIKVSNNSRTVYEELLQINKGISIHQMHLRILDLEIYKSIIQFNRIYVVLF